MVKLWSKILRLPQFVSNNKLDQATLKTLKSVINHSLNKSPSELNCLERITQASASLSSVKVSTEFSIYISMSWNYSNKLLIPSWVSKVALPLFLIAYHSCDLNMAKEAAVFRYC